MSDDRPPVRRAPAFLTIAPTTALGPHLHRRPRPSSSFSHVQRPLVAPRRAATAPAPSVLSARGPADHTHNLSSSSSSSSPRPMDWLSALNDAPPSPPSSSSAADAGATGSTSPSTKATTTTTTTTTTMATTSSAVSGPSSDLSGPPVGGAATVGFALADANGHSFSTLSVDATPFEHGGAYAIFNDAGDAQYMGYSKNVSAKLVFHAQLQPQHCASFRVYLPPVPPELMSPDLLESVLEYWVRELGDVPRGNSVDRALWEQARPVDRKQEPSSPETQLPQQRYQHQSGSAPSPATAAARNVVNDKVPVRERSTARRTASQRGAGGVGAAPTSAGFATGVGAGTRETGSSAGVSGGWAASDEDYVEVEVDPLDPFSATKRRRTTRESWDEFDEVETREDWYPLLMIAGFAGLVWLFGVLGNALPAATPAGGL